MTESVAPTKLKISQDALNATHVDGFDAWKIAIELELLTMELVSKGIYDNRNSLCGGEDNNRFKLWRKLQLQYGCLEDNKAFQAGGFRIRVAYPRCRDEAGLAQQIAD